MDEIITAIGDDGALFPIPKLRAHTENIRHLAISVFVFHDGEMLLQRRAAHKYHSGGRWANTCCSHPRWTEDIADCAGRRLHEELGLRVPLSQFGTIAYSADVGGLHENEVAHCFFGTLSERPEQIDYNTEEVMEVRWASIPDTLSAMARRAEDFAPWLRIYLTQHKPLFDRLPGQAGD